MSTRGERYVARQREREAELEALAFLRLEPGQFREAIEAIARAVATSDTESDDHDALRAVEVIVDRVLPEPTPDA